MVVMFAFLNSCYYFTSAYYIKLLCFFIVSYYSQLSLLSILRAVWYKVKDSEFQGNCFPTHVLLFLLSLTGLLNEKIPCFIYMFHLRVERANKNEINFLLVWISIISRIDLFEKKIPYQIQEIGNLILDQFTFDD